MHGRFNIDVGFQKVDGLPVWRALHLFVAHHGMVTDDGVAGPANAAPTVISNGLVPEQADAILHRQALIGRWIESAVQARQHVGSSGMSMESSMLHIPQLVVYSTATACCSIEHHCGKML